MKRILLTISILLCFAVVKAAPVGLEEARSLGSMFVKAHFEAMHQGEELSLVYSQSSFYVFNVGNVGFVILSADDSYRPVIGYSKEGVFDPNDMAPALQDYLDGITVSRAGRNAVQDPSVAAEWQMLRQNGHLNELYHGKGDDFLVETRWDQNYPYNYCCPAASGGPGGHVYAGCVATAAAQLMRYWNFPEQGRGSHTYYPEDHPEYGPLTANFGATTYDWANMPASISSGSPMEQIEAVGQLIYHVGVSVDMNYRPSSSGAVTGNLCYVMPQYFYYTNQMDNIYRENHTHESYMELITEAIDMSWPMVHRGNGHAYVLDGYDANGLVHFNWGWGGSSDGWFDIDGHNYAEGESVIYNYVPEEIYSATSDAPTDLVVTPEENNELAATVSWVNPTLTLTGQLLTSIDRVVVMRDNDIIFSEDNVTPGTPMSFVDTTVPCYDIYSYKVFVVSNGQRGRSQKITGVNIGPLCTWKFVVSSSNFQGWRGAYISVRNGAGKEAGRVTLNNSNPSIVETDVPLGGVKLVWVPSDDTQTNFNITFNVKGFDGVSVFSYDGMIGGMAAGVFYEGNNGCGNDAPAGIPGEVTASDEGGLIVLSWPSAGKDIIGYNVYRDGLLCHLVSDNEFFDENASIGGHCYQVSVFGDGGESELSNEVCATAGENCDAGKNLWYDMLPSGKPIISWEAPETEGLSGFAVFRKENDGNYVRIKLISPTKREYKETMALNEGNWYSYQVKAIYEDIDCISAPFKSQYGNEYFVKIFYSLTGVDDVQDGSVKLYPNPVSDQLTVEGAEMTSVVIFDLLGQQVYEKHCQNGTTQLNVQVDALSPGVYVIRIHDGQNVSSRYFVKK